MVNCVYPSFLDADEQPVSVLRRLQGFQGNASSLDHDQLDGANALQSDSLRQSAFHIQTCLIPAIAIQKKPET